MIQYSTYRRPKYPSKSSLFLTWIWILLSGYEPFLRFLRVGGTIGPDPIETLYDFDVGIVDFDHMGMLVSRFYLLINLFDDSIKKNTSTLRPNFGTF